MKKKYLLTLIALVPFFSAIAQDFKVICVEHVPNDLTARKTILTEKLDGGKNCAVLRISTQNILEKDRDEFLFECDMGSVIRERRKDGGEICLWVSPGIKILKIKHNSYGNFVLHIPERLHDNVQSLNTYRIILEGTKEIIPSPIPTTTLPTRGSSQIVFLPTPNDAELSLNDDSIGVGAQLVRSFPGTYRWNLKHPLFHPRSGEVTFVSGKTDTLEITLNPAYGFLKIVEDDTLRMSDVTVCIDGVSKGQLPFQSDRIHIGQHSVTLCRQEDTLASEQVMIKELQTCVVNVGKFINGSFIPAYKSLTGKLNLRANIDSVLVFIDGNEVGMTPLLLDSIVIGPHQLVMAKKGWNRLRKDILIEENMELSLTTKMSKVCMLTITSDIPGDAVYVDNVYIGETPVTTGVRFGRHHCIVKRGNRVMEKDIKVNTSDLEATLSFALGQLVKIATDNNKGWIIVDGANKGRKSIETYLLNGSHYLKAKSHWRSGGQFITISDTLPIENTIVLNTRFDSPSKFLKNGITFLTGNVSYVTRDNPIFGITFGGVGKNNKLGYYISLSGNTNNELFNCHTYANKMGLVDQVLPIYSGEKMTFRASATAGFVIPLSSPVCVRLGFGYGIRESAWQTVNKNWVILEQYSWRNLEASCGLQLNIYDLVLSADILAPLDVITKDKSLFELKFGVGFAIKRRAY